MLLLDFLTISLKK